MEELGGKPVESHPSTFWLADSKMLLTIYVDDLMASGPVNNHKAFWEALAQKVHMDEFEPLDRFLGRHHNIAKSNPHCRMLWIISFQQQQPQQQQMLKINETAHALLVPSCT